jgi:glycosyltransferase involved in cell wall biosynthesis
LAGGGIVGMTGSGASLKPLLIVVMAVDSPWSVDIACRLSRNDYRVLVANGRSSSSNSPTGRLAEGLIRLAADGIAVVDISSGPTFVPQAIRFARQLKWLCQEKGASHLLTLYGGNYAIAAWLSGFRPYSVYWVGSDINIPGWWRTLCLSWPFRSARLNAVNGRNLANAARQRFGDHGVAELYIGVDTDEWQIAGNKRHGKIVCTRWFEPIYDNATIVRGFVEEGCATDGMSLVFTSSGSELGECRNLALRLPGRKLEEIEFLGGVDRDRLRDELQSAESFVSMSLSDGTSTALLEAMSCGCFPILSDIEANREWLDHGCDMELVKVGDSGGLAQALRRVHSDADRRRHAAVRNREIVERIASSPRNMTRLADMLRHAAADDFECVEGGIDRSRWF